MRKALTTALVALMVTLTAPARAETTVRWNAGMSGNILVTLAEEKGYFAQEGIKIEHVSATANVDAMTLLATGKVDVVSNSGTSNPLQQIAAGVDLTIFGGHMVNGAMPVIARKGTQWHGVQDLIGKRFACNPAYFAFTGAVMDLGYEDPLNAVDWVTYSTYNDALAAVIKGEVDYALMGTGHNYLIANTPEVEVMTYQSDVMPNYSCCRLVAPSSFVKEQPETVKSLLKALLRAQAYYEGHKEEAAALQAKAIGTTVDYVNVYMQDPHYLVHVDPLKKSVLRAWKILGTTGFLDAKAKEIDIEDHINTALYKEALDELKAQDLENSEFYERAQVFFDQND